LFFKQVRADVKYSHTLITDKQITEGLWSEPIIIAAPPSPSPTSSSSSSASDDDGFPAFGYAIIGVILALFILFIVIVVIYVCCRQMGGRYYDKSEFVSNKVVPYYSYVHAVPLGRYIVWAIRYSDGTVTTRLGK